MVVPTPSHFASNHKPVAKAVHTLNHAAGAKWVPINKSFITLTRIILRSACERLGLATLAVTLRCVTHQGYRHLVLVNDESDLQIAAVGRVEEFIISTDISMGAGSQSLDVGAALTLPMDYSRQRLGYLLAQAEQPVASVAAQEALKHALLEVVDDVVRTIKRYQTRYRAIYIYGDQYFWIGNSAALRQLEQRIDQLARTSLPVVIRGDKGTGKVIAARSLHCHRHADILPFIESDCSEWQESAVLSILESLCTYARGGTLLLRNLDSLPFASFELLRSFWDRRLKLTNGQDIHLLFSLSSRNAEGAPGMNDWLAAIAQDLRLPCLRERRDDIRDLGRFFIKELGLAIELDLAADAWYLLEMLHWEKNADELKQLLENLCLEADQSPITLEQVEALIPLQPDYSQSIR